MFAVLYQQMWQVISITKWTECLPSELQNLKFLPRRKRNKGIQNNCLTVSWLVFAAKCWSTWVENSISRASRSSSSAVGAFAFSFFAASRGERHWVTVIFISHTVISHTALDLFGHSLPNSQVMPLVYVPFLHFFAVCRAKPIGLSKHPRSLTKSSEQGSFRAFFACLISFRRKERKPLQKWNLEAINLSISG